MLESLEIAGATLSPKFNPDVYEYEVTLLDNNIDYLDISYTLDGEGTVTIYGNELTKGNNHVLVEVYTDKVRTYTLNVYKEKEAMVFKTVEPKEEPVIKNAFLNDIKTPGIAVVCFILILTLFCIIFKRK